MKKYTVSDHPAVAIIGMGGMFAGSENLDAYWRTLLGGMDCITEPPEGRRDLNDYFSTDPAQPDHIYCKRGGFLPATAFDPTEFGIPPTTLEATDTSQLLGLVGAKMALSDAGYGDDKGFDHERTSVILGITGTQELVIALGSRLGHPIWRRALSGKGLDSRQISAIMDELSDSYVSWQENSFPGLLGNVVAGRICNRLNLGGTNCGVDAACASSLGAVHLALLELYTGKSDMVVTGGVDTLNDIFMHMCFSKTGVLSKTGDARPFSENADGTVLGEGVGMLVLKRLEDAKRDNDRIYAVIRGIGASSDGKSQSIYAPRVEGQARALSDAYAHAGVAPETVGLVEAHGTGTRVGDEVEFSALKKVFGAAAGKGKCALGSVKSMIGHAKAAAGAAGLIKAALALYHKVLPPTLKADSADPKLQVADSPFYLSTRTRPWFNPGNTPRRSGVSAFGFGGSNFHVVLEEYNGEKTEPAWDGAVELVALSAADPAGLVRSLADLGAQLKSLPSETEVRYAAGQSRKTFDSQHPHRLVMVVDFRQGRDAMDGVFSAASAVVAENRTVMSSANGIYYAAGDAPAGKTAFLFPGQGSQYVGMGKDLVCRFPEAMAAVAAAGKGMNGDDPLWACIFPEPPLSDEDRQRQDMALRQTHVAQPAIGAISLAMLNVLARFGIKPDGVAGHSYGELSALFAAGCMDADTFHHLSLLRGRLMADAGKNKDAGAMLAVFASPEVLTGLLKSHPDGVLANHNSPNQGVLSGPEKTIAAIQAECAQKKIKTVLLPVAAAFHSPLVAAAQMPFAQAVEAAAFADGKIPIYANVTAGMYPGDASAAADLLGRQLVSPVLFQQMIEQMADDGIRVFVEVGPKAVLSGLVRAILGAGNRLDDTTVLAVDRSAGKDGILDLAHVIGHLAAIGLTVDLTQWERPVPQPRTRNMMIPLAGNNYRTPQSPKPAFKLTKTETTATGPVIPVAPSSSTDTGQPAPTPPHIQTQAMTNHSKFEKKTTPSAPASPPLASPATAASGSHFLNEALWVVQKGLDSIGALHQQTAAAHQKFLETQAMATKSLEAMMQSTRDWVSAMATGTQPAVFAQKASPSPLSRPAPPQPEAPQEMPLPSPVLPRPADPGVIPAASVRPESPSSEVTVIQNALVEIISELTGYPPEMLGLDQDIESDLG
ncbi:acyltransferase domain-containing protein, partial [Desulfosarcina sp. OttesenSCG-928-G17]|nr:acyltransferase domain-containing protein [Desulfosarcina sp. OttesenSCG-928-G17]